jgi:hypothetical protein
MTLSKFGTIWAATRTDGGRVHRAMRMPRVAPIFVDFSAATAYRSAHPAGRYSTPVLEPSGAGITSLALEIPS